MLRFLHLAIEPWRVHAEQSGNRIVVLAVFAGTHTERQIRRTPADEPCRERDQPNQRPPAIGTVKDEKHAQYRETHGDAQGTVDPTDIRTHDVLPSG
jgi:hypothetical protein